MSEILLQLKNVDAHYDELQVLDGVNFGIDEGEIVALMGPNGAGKSTILKTIFGMASASKGKVMYHEQAITPVPHKLVKQGIVFVPQGRRVFNNLTVKENIELGAYVENDKQEIKRRFEKVLEIFPALKSKLKSKSGDLSGGQQQMVAIARGLMANPRVLLLDEPTLGLAPKVVKEIFAVIKDINLQHKTAIVIVEHNVKSLLDIADRGYILDKGKIVHTNAAAKIASSDILEQVFLGKA